MKTELLAPAGSFEAMRAAINAGADAVYMGGTKFGARAYAENPDEDGMIKAIEFCHLRGKKLYMTVNTLFKEKELYESLFEFLKPYYEAGLDAVIVQDIGAVRFIENQFPGLDIHLSTQCTITMSEGAADIISNMDAGTSVTRLVPARELSLSELEALRSETGLEIEVFIHGALCYCYSGQCLLSSMAGGRSGNRGRCAQPCRRRYTAAAFSTKSDNSSETVSSGYFLSPKDMCALPYIHKMIEAGIDSFKIEGRMKSPEYVAGVVSVYRKYIDRYYELGGSGYEGWLSGHSVELEEDIDILRELYNRGGFNNGYLFSHNGPEMMSMHRPNHSGIKVGEVTKCEGRKAFIKLSKPVGKGDVLEIRLKKLKEKNDEVEQALYEFTTGEAINRGVVFSVLTMKERQAVPGLEVYRTRNAFLLDRLRKDYLDTDSKIPVDIYFSVNPDEEIKLSISALNGKKVTVRGIKPEPAQNAPTSAAAVKKQLLKLGDTEFEADDVDVQIDGSFFIPVGELNRMRREACGKLRDLLLSGFKRSLTSGLFYGAEGQDSGLLSLNSGQSGDEKLQKAGFTVSVSVTNLSQLKEALRYPFVDCIHYDISACDYSADTSLTDEIYEMCLKHDKKLCFALPIILRNISRERVRSFIERYIGKTGFIVRNREEAEILNRIISVQPQDIKASMRDVVIRTDYNVYTMNTMAVRDSDWGYTVSPELNASELQPLAGEKAEFIIYGLMPVMFSAQCVYKNVFGCCTGGKRLSLKDEKGYCFRTEQVCGECYNIIYNSSVLNLLHRFEDVKRIGFGSLRLSFTFESASETGLVLNCMRSVSEGKKYILPDEIMGMKYTNGHFCRGVE